VADADLPQVLDLYIAQVRALRDLPVLPGPGHAPADVLEHLHEIRSRLDRVEELLSNTLRLRAAAQRNAVIASGEVDDAWDLAIRRLRAAPVQSGGEFTSARERHAEANLAVLDARHAARRAVQTAHRCEEAAEVIRLAHRGLDGARADILTVLRTLAFESHLER